MDTLRGTADHLTRTLAFVRDAFAKWREKGVIRGEEYDSVAAYYQGLQQSGAPPDALTPPSPGVCWSCKSPVGVQTFCPDCGAPANTELVEQLRYLICLCHEVKKHEQAGRLDLSCAHGCLADLNGRIAALRRKLDRQRAPFAVPVAVPAKSSAERFAAAPPPPSASEPSSAAPHRNFLEMLLDPRSIQWLLASGAAVLVLGVVIWLAASGLFENPLFVAVIMAVGNVLLLAGGWAMIRLTRYQLAGRAVTLLACLLMPLNLWFYDSQGLITIKDGGHLWLAALVCCVLYAVSASLLRDPMLVFVFVGGVALTGLLLLADHSVHHFWEASAPAVFLVGLGLVCIHVERSFPPDAGPFTRRRFGLAFFWSGQAVSAAGLLLVLGAQLTGALLLLDTSFNEFYYKTLEFANRPDLVTDVAGQLRALLLVAAGTYAYVYSDLVVRKIGVYIHLAVVSFLWAEVLLLNLAFHYWPGLPHMEACIIALALTGLAANFALTALLPPESLLRRTGPALALCLCLVPLLLGILLHVRAVALPMGNPLHYTLGWPYVAAMAVTAVACRIGAHLHRAERPWLATVYLFGSAGAVLLGAAGLLRSLYPEMPWEQQAPLLMLVPLAYLIASRLYRGRSSETAVVWAAHAGTVVLLISCLGLAFQGFAMQQGGQPLNLLLAVFFTEAALFYLLAAIWRDREFAVYACTAAAAAAVWQVMTYYHQRPEFYIGAFAVLGLLLLLAYRFAAPGKGATIGLGRAAFQSANALLSLAAIAGALLALSALAGNQVDPLGKPIFGYAGLEAVLTATSVAALFLVRQPNWRRWYLLAAVGSGALTVLVLLLQAELTGWQKLELVCIVIGAALLITSHLGWYREQERENDLVSFGLFLGSMLVGVPLTYSVLYCRFNDPTNFDMFHTLNEVGMLAAGLLLLGAGTIMHIKSTTLVGGIMLTLYVLGLVAFLRLPDMLKTTAVYLMIGGGLFFAVGLVLSIYRDRLLTLPTRIKRHEGVFRVLNWR